jgi:hypothetical protein
MQHCTECKSELPPGARFCIECSAPVYATGKTERLSKETRGKEYTIVYEGDEQTITVKRFIPDRPLGRLNGEWIYEYSYEVWSDPNFMVMPDPLTFVP